MAIKYRPSNGTEGEIFMDYYCCNCEHEWDNEEEACDILGRSGAFDVDDPNYPEEWTYNDEGKPTCTAFELKDGEYQRKYRCEKTIDMFNNKDKE